jgi:hypothetical protein
MEHIVPIHEMGIDGTVYILHNGRGPPPTRTSRINNQRNLDFRLWILMNLIVQLIWLHGIYGTSCVQYMGSLHTWLISTDPWRWPLAVLRTWGHSIPGWYLRCPDVDPQLCSTRGSLPPSSGRRYSWPRPCRKMNEWGAVLGWMNDQF